MLEVLADRAYRHLFLAQVIALFGTGLMTVALALLADDLAGGQAGAVIGTALAIKMTAYVFLSPVAAALTARLPRRPVLIGADLLRAATALVLPFVTEIWQVYALVFLLQSCSAVFTPTFQAVIPEILPDERRYTRALSLTRLAYDIENLVSPSLAALLLALTSYHWLFSGTVIGFLSSAALVLATPLPARGAAPPQRFRERLTRGLRIYLATPRLRALLALNLAVAAAGALVLVNTVVIVKTLLGRPAEDVALAMAVYGAGSMTVAVLLPRLLDRMPERPVMLAGGALQLAALAGFALGAGAGLPLWPVLLGAWLAIGAGSATVLTPAGRLLRRSSGAADRTAVFTAQFALSHACWLVTYPLAGWLGAAAGILPATLALAALAAAGTLAARRLWPSPDPEAVAHLHRDLDPADPHLAGAEPTAAGWRHSHGYVIDERHDRWP